MLSADVTPEAKRECLEAGADVFLAKPIEAARLLEEQNCRRCAAPWLQERLPNRLRLKARGRRRAPWSRGRYRLTVNSDTLADLEELGSTPALSWTS